MKHISVGGLAVVGYFVGHMIYGERHIVAACLCAGIGALVGAWWRLRLARRQ